MSRFNAIVVAHRAGTDIVAALAGNDQIDGGDGDDRPRGGKATIRFPMARAMARPEE